jgi:hypothetical protein
MYNSVQRTSGPVYGESSELYYYICPFCKMMFSSTEDVSIYSKTTEKTINLALEQSKERLVKLSTVYANGAISEAVFIETSKKLEAKIAYLEAIKASGNFGSCLKLVYYQIPTRL